VGEGGRGGVEVGGGGCGRVGGGGGRPTWLRCGGRRVEERKEEGDRVGE